MFCPKCGKQLSDGAQFCKYCGAKIESPISARGGAPSDPKRSGVAPQIGSAPTRTTHDSHSSLLGISATGWAARVAAIVTVFTMLLPWLSFPGMRTLQNYATTLLGIVLPSTPERSSYAYSMYGLSDVTSTLNTLGRSSLSTLLSIFALIWLVALIIVIAGLVRSFVTKKSTGLLAGGALVAAFVALAWGLFVIWIDSCLQSALSNSFGFSTKVVEPTVMVGATVVLGVVAFVLCQASKKEGQR